MTGAVERVAVFGEGVAAALAALAIARAFGRLGVSVSWVTRSVAIDPHAALVAPPDLIAFHRLLGIDEATLLDDAATTLNMGQQFVGWAGGDGAFLHAYGDAGSAFASLPFVQHWSRARHAGLQVALEDFCLAAAAAKQGRIGQPRDPAMRQAVKHGYHLDTARYFGLLVLAGERAGVRRIVDDGACLLKDDGIALSNGETIEADLLIDADGAGFGLPVARCDRLIRASAARFDPPPLFSRVTAHRAGWTTLIPLRDRTAVEFVFASRDMTDADAVETLRTKAGAAIASHGPIEVLPERSAPSQWSGKRVAIGSASSALDAAGLLQLQLAIAQLILLWPIDRDEMPEAAIYNEEMAGTHARIDDFTAQHFHLNRRIGEPFWDAMRAAPISPALESKVALFAARGKFAHFNHEAHVEDGWALCMAGYGVVPRSTDPQAMAVEDTSLMAEFRRQLQAIAAEVRQMETHEQAIARLQRGGQ